MTIRDPHLKAYCETGFKAVEGWCMSTIFPIIDLLGSVDFNKNGGCFEIGVHHGKFYIMLNCLVEEQFQSYAVDLFDDQHLNVDRSGRGSLLSFKSNLEKYDRYAGKNTRIICGDSTDNRVIKNIEQTVGLLRFVSIDGGHTAEHTVSDLVLANSIVSNEGVVILDDILNRHWLGVLDGAVTFIRRQPTLVPFAIGHNKLFFCKISYRAAYLRAVSEAGLNVKTVDFFSHRIAALH